MKLIIDIPEEVVTKIQNGEDYRYDIHTTIAQGIPYEPKGDLISREALKEKLKPCEADVCEFSCEGCHFRVVTAEDIDNAPTVEERPKGDWTNCGHSLYICSECGIISCCKGNFCCECGADMRGEEE